MSTSLYVFQSGDIIYVQVDGIRIIRTYQVGSAGDLQEIQPGPARTPSPLDRDRTEALRTEALRTEPLRTSQATVLHRKGP